MYIPEAMNYLKSYFKNIHYEIVLDWRAKGEEKVLKMLGSLRHNSATEVTPSHILGPRTTILGHTQGLSLVP